MAQFLPVIKWTLAIRVAVLTTRTQGPPFTGLSSNEIMKLLILCRLQTFASSVNSFVMLVTACVLH